ncbi:Retinoic acid induced 16-like protein-domain-containing protein [Lentinula boryana]|uniref:Retinoic acid induced 16-like protein-domain-containing protein n=1 Tax=Lentinula boryana TaxID=40481 RepID=A0ABQ8QQM3_9AGAR|nr:Retinoic acid induced 16-like protein-domain-containing protein [Lentinula boryana]
MDYFQKFLRPGTQPLPKEAPDYTQEFSKSWNFVKVVYVVDSNTLQHPDERQLARGIKSTDVPAHLQSMVNSLVAESTRIDEGTTGGCLEYLLKNDVLGTLVRLSEADRPFGIQAEVLRAVQNMVVLLDEQFLVHSAVHKAVLRLLRNCAGDDLHEQLDGRRRKIMGAAGNAVRSQPSEFEEDLVNLLCILCSRIRTFRELLMIFFHDKHWYRSEPLFSLEEQDEEEDEEEESTASSVAEPSQRSSSPTPSQATVTSAPVSSVTTKKPEYEFLLFNYLLRFVHREGQIGEFARAGLLLLMDVAMSPGEPVHLLTGEKTSSETTADPITDAALALAEYILDGDFSEVLGAGLGAVYSMLPSKLEFRPPTNADRSQETGMVIGNTWLETEDEKEMLEVFRTKSWAMGVEDANSPDFKYRLDHFLKMLEFIQDVLRRNIIQEDVDESSLVGTAIVNSILDAVRRIFLENVLYPTILECSDADGSAVAVMSYIDIMIRTLQDGQLANLLIDFLISEDNEEVKPRPRPQSLMMLNNAPPQSNSAAADKEAKIRRRKSSAMALLEMEAPDTRKQSEYFTSMARFTLKDLILSNLRSTSQPTSTAALQLLQAMLLQHPHLCIDKLLVVTADPLATAFPHPIMISSRSREDEDEDEETFIYPGNEEEKKGSISSEPLFYQPDTTFSTHEREMDLYLALVSRVDPSHNSDPFSTGYDHYLRDALFSIQDQPAYQLDEIHGKDTEARQKFKHRLNVNDPVISTVLESLRRFFSNTPEFNIALTGVLSTLAIHPDRSLAGWLTFASNDSTPNNNDDMNAGLEANSDGDDRSIDYRIEERLANNDSFLPASSMDERSRPVVHTIYYGLVAQLERYRRSVDNFDRFLLERRQGLLFDENLSDALSLAIQINEEIPQVPQISELAQQSKPKPKQSTSSSIVSLFTPKRGKTKSATIPVPSTPPKKKETKPLSASPFAPHYQKTGAIIVEPFVAPVPASSPWTPVKTPRKWNADEEDVFSAGWSERTPVHTAQDDSDEEEESGKAATTVTLSRLLDNVVILEESIKELVTIIHARRSLGIDSVRYL